MLSFVFPGFISPTLNAGAQYLALGLLATCISLSVWFHRGRTLFASLLLLFLAITFTSPLSRLFSNYNIPRVYQLLQLSAPLMLVAIAISPKRRILSPFSFVWLILLGVIALLVWSVPNVPISTVIFTNLFELSFFPTPLSDILPQISDVSLVVLCLGLICVLLISAWHRQEPHLSLAWITSYAGLAISLVLLSTPERAVIWLASAAASLVIALLQHAHAMAFLDALTGIPNRRALDEQLSRMRSKFAIAMADIDHFKEFNDTHGHKLGDQVLRKTASQLQQIRGGGRVFRYGGEEFAIVFLNRSAKEAGAFCQDVRNLIEQEPFRRRSHHRPSRKPKHIERSHTHNRPPGTHVTVSIGVAEPCELAKTPLQVLQLADKALYQAKKMGRNKVIVARPPQR